VPTLNPLGLVKDVTGTATHLARGAAGLGLKVAGTVGEQVFRRVPGVDRHVASTADRSPADDGPEPVNVVEELDLDPAPVDDATAEVADPAPVTTIDAQADPGTVDVTPADIADQVERGPGPDGS
jgi:hypothetical protein